MAVNECAAFEQIVDKAKISRMTAFAHDVLREVAGARQVLRSDCGNVAFRGARQPAAIRKSTHRRHGDYAAKWARMDKWFRVLQLLPAGLYSFAHHYERAGDWWVSDELPRSRHQ